MFAARNQLLLLLASLALLACTGARCSSDKVASKTADRVTAPKPRPDLRLLLLTDPKGYLEPCGCQLRPLGGVDKLAHVVAGARADGVPTLLVAAGNLTFGTELRPEDRESAATQEEWRAETLVEAWNQLGLAAVAPGRLDLVQPIEQSAKLLSLSKFPWLVSNLQPAEAGARLSLVTEGRLLSARDRKVGVMGLVAPDASIQSLGGTLDGELAAVAKRAATALRSQGAKLVIALVTGDRRTARSLAGVVDVVVMGGLDLEVPLPPAVHKETIFVHAGYQGQRVVALDLELDAQGPVRDASVWSLRESQKALRQEASELRGKIREWEKAKNVAAHEIEAQRTRLLELERTANEQAEPSYDGRWFSAEVTELSPDVMGDKRIAETLNAFDRRVNEHNKTALANRLPLPAKEGAPHYAGSESCKGCHEDAYAWWRNSTKHGRAYATLENVHKEFNLNCVGCHVTGYNQPGGSTVTHVDNLKDVGCETCHGPGSQHNAEPNKAGLIARDTPESVCTTCHTHEHSDRFQYEAFKPMMIVPGHGLPKTREKAQ